MIFDSIEHAGQYKGLAPGVDRVLEEIRKYTKENYAVGSVELDGRNLFYSLNDYETRAAGSAEMEAHRKYIDVMYMVEGEETIFVKAVDQLSEVTKPYDEEIDAMMAKIDGDSTTIRLQAGSFVVLFPQDAHAPACHPGKPGRAKKIIGKVRVQ